MHVSSIWRFKRRQTAKGRCVTFLFRDNEENHRRIKLDDPRERTLQLYHVIYVEHTHEGCPLPSVESGLSDYILIRCLLDKSK